ELSISCRKTRFETPICRNQIQHGSHPLRRAVDYHSAVRCQTWRCIEERGRQNLYASRCETLFGTVLRPAVGADQYHRFTFGVDIRILVLRTFPGNTLWRTAVDIHFINLRTTGLVRSKCQVLAIREPGRFGIVTATISHLADLTRSQIHYVQVQTTGFRQGECQFAAVWRECRCTVVTRE